MKRLSCSLLLLTLFISSNVAAIDPKDKLQRQLAREEAVQMACINRVLSREMPDELKSLPVFGEIIWTVKELPFIPKGPPGGVSGAGMVVVGGKIYLAGGFIPEGDGTQDTAYRSSRWAHCYDPATDQWTQLPDLPARREYTRAIATEDAVYVLGGGAQEKPFKAYADVYRLDIGKTALAWQTLSPLTVPVTHMAADRVGSFMIVAGGNRYDFAEKGYSPKTIQGVTNVFDLTKPDQGWQQRAPIPGTPRGWSASAVLGGKFYMLGGVTWNEKGRQRLQETLSYDPTKNEWQRLTDFPWQISGWEGDAYAGRYIIVVGGAGARWNDVPFVYDTQEDRWMRSTSPLPPGGMFNDPGVCIIGDTIYVAGGEGAGGSHFNHFLVGRIKPRSTPAAATVKPKAVKPVNIGSRRELFVDRFLIDSLHGAQLFLHEPRDEGPTFRFDQPWEGLFCGYSTVIRDGKRFLLYYRAKPTAAKDGLEESTCVAESEDGIHWTRPKLGLVEFQGSRDNNIVLALDDLSHNFSPVLDTNPAAPPEQRFKALGGWMKTGLVAFVSPDGLHWKKLREEPVLTKDSVPYPAMFDSQNLAFWSETEKRYVAYFRVFKDSVRRICRAESVDFINWSKVTLMEYRNEDGGAAPVEHLYTNQTHPYFRAPHLYVSLAARFMPKRQVLTDEEAEAINVHPKYFKDTSDAIFMTTRGGAAYDRTFPGGFIRPGLGAQNWVSRTTYPALNSVQTGPAEISVYTNQDYAQPSAHLRRYSLRLDGFASLRAPYDGGEMITKPLTFQGRQLLLNFSTSAAGGIRVEIQDATGKAIPGFALGDSVETIGNEIERAAKWKAGSDVGALAGKPVRLRFVMKDADIYALRFAD